MSNQPFFSGLGAADLIPTTSSWAADQPQCAPWTLVERWLYHWIKSFIFQFFGSHLHLWGHPATHWAASFVSQISHFELTWFFSAAAARASVFGRKSWVLELNPSRSEHPIQRPIQPWNNGVGGSSTFTGLITHLTGPHARLNSCIMSAVTAYRFTSTLLASEFCPHSLFWLLTPALMWWMKLHPTSILFTNLSVAS